MSKTDFHILSEPWAITGSALDDIAREVQTKGLGIFDGSDESEDMPYVTSDGIAVVDVSYSLWKYSYTRIRDQVAAALDSPQARAIVFRVNSPGGIVPGCKELSDYLYSVRDEKPLYAYVNGQMCSAAYWIGSAAKVISAPVTASVGSIGVRTLHIDWSKRNDEVGLKYTHLFAGEYKALGNEDEPLNEKARDYIQDRLDKLYTIFVDSVATNRGISHEEAMAMADGRVFLAQDALDKGLIDRVDQDFYTFTSYITKEISPMKYDEFKASHPELYEQVKAEGAATANSENGTAIKEAVEAETSRVLDLAGAVLPEDAKGTLDAIVKSGATVDAVKALKGAFSVKVPTPQTEDNAKDTTRQQILDGLHHAHSEGVEPGEPAPKAGDQTVEDLAQDFLKHVL